MILPLQLRASSTDRTFSCNGSLLAVPRVPVREDAAEATEGSLLHFLIASRLVKELGAIPPEGGLPVPVMPKGYTLPAFSAWIVDWAVRRVCEEVPPDWSLMVEPEYAYEYSLPRAVHVPVSEIIGPIPADVKVLGGYAVIDRFTLTGHEDWRAISPDGKRAKSGDWKSGTVGTEAAETNWQVASYLALGKKAWPELEESMEALYQPRIDEEATGIERISRTTLTGAQLDAMNIEIAEQVCRALENRYETNSGPKQCRYCNVALTRPMSCPSLRAEIEFMKAKLTSSALLELRNQPNDALLADFVISGRTLTTPIKAATDMLHERIDLQGYVDSGSGNRITVKTKRGAYKIPDPSAFMAKMRAVLLTDDRIASVVKPSMDRLKDEIAAVKELPRTSKDKDSAESFFDTEFRPLVEQGVTRELVIT